MSPSPRRPARRRRARRDRAPTSSPTRAPRGPRRQRVEARRRDVAWRRSRPHEPCASKARTARRHPRLRPRDASDSASRCRLKRGGLARELVRRFPAQRRYRRISASARGQAARTPRTPSHHEVEASPTGPNATDAGHRDRRQAPAACVANRNQSVPPKRRHTDEWHLVPLREVRQPRRTSMRPAHSVHQQVPSHGEYVDHMTGLLGGRSYGWLYAAQARSIRGGGARAARRSSRVARLRVERRRHATRPPASRARDRRPRDDRRRAPVERVIRARDARRRAVARAAAPSARCGRRKRRPIATALAERADTILRIRLDAKTTARPATDAERKELAGSRLAGVLSSVGLGDDTVYETKLDGTIERTTFPGSPTTARQRVKWSGRRLGSTRTRRHRRELGDAMAKAIAAMPAR